MGFSYPPITFLMKDCSYTGNIPSLVGEGVHRLRRQGLLGKQNHVVHPAYVPVALIRSQHPLHDPFLSLHVLRRFRLSPGVVVVVVMTVFI